MADALDSLTQVQNASEASPTLPDEAASQNLPDEAASHDGLFDDDHQPEESQQWCAGTLL
jgi:hypothetical protein